MKRLLCLAALGAVGPAGIAACAAAKMRTTTLQSLTTAVRSSGAGDVAAWSVPAGHGAFRLALSVSGHTVRPAIPVRKGMFDVSVGSDAVVYSRCSGAYSPISIAETPVTLGSCRLYRYSIAARREQRLGAPVAGALYSPAVSGSTIAFLRRRGDGKVDLMVGARRIFADVTPDTGAGRLTGFSVAGRRLVSTWRRGPLAGDSKTAPSITWTTVTDLTTGKSTEADRVSSDQEEAFTSPTLSGSTVTVIHYRATSLGSDHTPASSAIRRTDLGTHKREELKPGPLLYTVSPTDFSTAVWSTVSTHPTVQLARNLGPFHAVR